MGDEDYAVLSQKSGSSSANPENSKLRPRHTRDDVHKITTENMGVSGP